MMNAVALCVTIVAMLSLVLLGSFLRFVMKPKNDTAATLDMMAALRRQQQNTFDEWQKTKQAVHDRGEHAS